MYPQRSCGVSNMALVLCKKKRGIEQINKDHQIPPISFGSPCPHELKLKGDADGATQTHMDYAHMAPVLQSTVFRRRLTEQILAGILNFLIIVTVL